MQIMNNIAMLAILFGAFLAFFSTLVVFRLKHGNQKANRFFGIMLCATMVFLLRGFLLLSGLYTHYPLVVELGDNIRYFIGPAFYFYVQASANPDFRLKPNDVVHLLPLVFNLTVKMKFYFNPPSDQILFVSQWLDGSILQPGFFWDSVSRIVFFVCLSLYVFLAFRIYRKNRERIRKSFPFGKISSSWILILAQSLLPCLLIWLLTIFFLIAGHSLRFFFIALHLAVAMVVFFGTYRIFTRPEILYSARPLKSARKYDRSRLDDRDYQAYFNRLKEFMERGEGYTDPDLTLPGLAEILSIPRNDLSRIINEKTGKTFNDYINYYRIRRVITLFEDPLNKNKTLLSLAFQAGFNSKTPFNAAFKKITGESPVAFRKKLMHKTLPLSVDARPPQAVRIAR